MGKTNEILISGPVTSSDILEISELVRDEKVEIHQLELKSQGITEMLQIVFNDFSVVSFARDLLLGEVLASAYSKIRPVVQYLKYKGRQVEAVCIEKDFLTEEKRLFTIYIAASPEQFEVIIRQLNSIPKEDLTPNTNETVVTIAIDKQGNISISRM